MRRGWIYGGLLLGAAVLGGAALAAGEGDCWRGGHGGLAMAAFGPHRGARPPMGPCAPARAEHIESVIGVVEQFAELTPPQRTAWEELKAKIKAGNARFDEACTAMRAGDPATPAERMAGIERMLEAGLAAVREIRPAFDAFHATLDEAQRAALDRLLRHHHRG